MTSSILCNILAELDQLKIFPWSENPHLRLFALFDGHGSRIECEFLSYVSNPSHGWVVCIGVPYGTETWQLMIAKNKMVI